MKLTILLTSILFVAQCSAQKSLPNMIKDQGMSKNELSVKIDKSDYTLTVFHKSKKLIAYPCVFGFNAINDKHEEGDGCTPEGVFSIRSKYRHKSWTYFIWIDYPNKESWRRFNKRKANGVISKRSTIGGEIGIHGVPEGADDMIADRTNWTLGCISLRNKDRLLCHLLF